MTTQLGSIDLLGEITSGGQEGTYQNLLPHTIELFIYGYRHRRLDIDKLIQVKLAAGCPKDFEVIAELEAIREKVQAPKDSAIE